MKRGNAPTIAFLFLIVSAALFLAAPSAQASGQWGGDIRIYGLGAGMEGSVGAFGREADVNLSFSDVLDHLKFGFMAESHIYKGKWAFNEDVIYTKLGMENNLVKADTTQWIIGFDGGYQFKRYVELYGGIRINALRNNWEFKGPLGFVAKPRKTWVDPIVGLRITPQLSKNWYLLSRFDVGGFGISSKFTYQVEGLLERRISPRAQLDFGYRVIGINYDKGDGIRRFLYDVTISGPEAGFTFNF